MGKSEIRKWKLEKRKRDDSGFLLVADMGRSGRTQERSQDGCATWTVHLEMVRGNGGKAKLENGKWRNGKERGEICS